MPQDIEQILKAEGIVEFEEDIRRLNREELAVHFASARSGRIILTPLLKSIIWSAFRRFQSGRDTPLPGNIRTFWYRWCKVVLSHIPDDDNVKTDPYETMLKAFSRMVLDLKLFQYADFDFTDDNWENRLIGTERPGILVFAEKTGWFRFLRKVHEKWGVSILALGGAPSALTSEYTYRDILAAMGDNIRPIQMIGLVDFDPSGKIIAEAFKNQSQQVGMDVGSMELVIHPKHYTAEELAMFRYPLPRRQKTKLRQWLDEVGGIDGEAYGLEIESMPLERLTGLVDELVERCV